MSCKFRDTLRKGTGETSRMFSICREPHILESFKKDWIEAPEWVKIRNPLVCEDCSHRIFTAIGTKNDT